MVAAPEAYAWSSCGYRLGYSVCDWLDKDPCYIALGNYEIQRQERYRKFLYAAVPEGEWILIREAVQRGQLKGRGAFVDLVEAILGRRIEKRAPGRPPRYAQ